MPYNKGDFTQQGVAGYVNGGLLLNNKRDVTTRISTDEESAGIDSVDIKIKDRLNDIEYHITGENLTEGENVIGGGGTDNTVKICKVKIVNETSDTQYFETMRLYDNPPGLRLSIEDELISYFNTITLQPNDEAIVNFLVAPLNLDFDHPENLYYCVLSGLAPISNIYTELNNVTLFEGVDPETQINFIVPVITDITKPASFTYSV